MRRVVIFVVILIVGVLLLLKCGNLNNKVKESSTNIPAAVISEPAKDTVYVVKVVTKLDTIYKTKYITREKQVPAKIEFDKIAKLLETTVVHDTIIRHDTIFKPQLVEAKPIVKVRTEYIELPTLIPPKTEYYVGFSTKVNAREIVDWYGVNMLIKNKRSDIYQVGLGVSMRTQYTSPTPFLTLGYNFKIK
jgi:hypothetical protein